MYNGHRYVEWGALRNVLASAMEAKLGSLFSDCQQDAAMQPCLQEMGYMRPDTPVAMDNSQAIDVCFYWIPN